jgi:hypothetical protein
VCGAIVTPMEGAMAIKKDTLDAVRQSFLQLVE